jgi:NAD+ diphosphatase
VTFQLGDVPALSRFTVDRQEPLRDDRERQRSLWPKALVLLVDRRGRVQVSGDSLVLVPAATLGPSALEEAVLLGEQDEVAYWAVLADDSAQDSAVDSAPADSAAAGSAAGSAAADDPSWADLRICGAALDATSAGLAVTAVAVVGWHRRAPFCPRCGHRSTFGKAGWARVCPNCSIEEYPRTDPAVICLVHDGADHVLLARQPTWPVGRFSVLAGFVEAGESLEGCVAREITEEVGVAVRGIRYLGSQPWPFPRSLMIGFEAVADRDQPVRPAKGEIAEAYWFTAQQVRAAIAAGSWANRTGPAHGQHDALILPGEVSIAGRMLAAWAH